MPEETHQLTGHSCFNCKNYWKSWCQHYGREKRSSCRHTLWPWLQGLFFRFTWPCWRAAWWNTLYEEMCTNFRSCSFVGCSSRYQQLSSTLWFATWNRILLWGSVPDWFAMHTSCTSIIRRTTESVIWMEGWTTRIIVKDSCFLVTYLLISNLFRRFDGWYYGVHVIGSPSIFSSDQADSRPCVNHDLSL